MGDMYASRHAASRVLRVLLAGTDESSTQSLREDLVSLGFFLCATEDDASGAVAAALSEEPDICILTAELRGSAVLATAQITSSLPRSRVVILATRSDEDDCLTHILAGASAYIERGIDRDALGEALREAGAGRAVVPPAVKRRLLDELRTELR
jgi:DNA-binding NarL/FixJ family response regulator